MRLKELKISGFRGFRLEQTISLDADIILVYGPNGTGKSSIVEALEWLLFGDISRRMLAKSRSEYRDSLRNIHCEANEETFVEARILFSNTELVLKRQYININRSTLFVDGQEASDLSTTGINIEQSRRPILSQGEIRSVLDTQQVDRHDEIAEILGLDILGDVRQKLMDLKNNMSRHQIISRAMGSRNACLQELQQYEGLRSLGDTIDALPYENESVLKTLYSCVNDTCAVKPTSIQSCQKVLSEERNKLALSAPRLTRVNALNIPGETFPISELLGVLREIIKICNQLSSITPHMMEVHLARFLKDGLSFVSDSTCPFCLQSTITDTRKSEIQSSIQTHEHGLNLEEQLRKSLASFYSQWLRIAEDLSLKVGIKAELEAALEEAIQELGKTTETVLFRRFCNVTLPKLQTEVANVNKQVEQFRQALINLLDHKPSISILGLISLGKKVNSNITKVCSNVHSQIQKLAGAKSAIMTKSLGLSPEIEQRLKKILALESLIQNIEYIRLAGVYQTRVRKLEILRVRIEEFENVKMGEMLIDLSADICSYYNKLNPDEPITFTGLSTGSGGHRQVRIEGESFGRKFNPVSCFSEAHANCLGISLYLSQRVGRNPQCLFFVLDDPVQSMDEEHADHLIDVLREVSQNKQLIVFSHQKAFCDVLDDVFQYRKYMKFRCGPYAKDGPQIEPEVAGIESYLLTANSYSRASKKEDRISKGAGNVRKALEAIVKELLIVHCGMTREMLRIQRIRLSRRLTQLAQSGFDKEDLATIRSILPISDQPHHDDPNWDIPSQRIERAVNLLDSICQKYNIGPYQKVSTVVGKVINYLPRIRVAIVEVVKPISIKDNLHIKGASTSMEMQLESMELDKQSINNAQPETIVGIQVPGRVRPNDFVYKIERAV